MTDSIHDGGAEALDAGEFETAVSLVKQVLDGKIELASELNRDARLSDLGFRSIEFVALILSLEEAAGCRIDAASEGDALQPLQTVGDVADLLKRIKQPE